MKTEKSFLFQRGFVLIGLPVFIGLAIIIIGGGAFLVAQQREKPRASDTAEPPKLISENQSIEVNEKTNVAPAPEKEITPFTTTEEKKIEVTEKVIEEPPPTTYTCVNDLSVTSRAYIVLLGLGDDDPFAKESLIKKLGNHDAKFKGVLAFDYDKNVPLSSIQADFVSSANAFVSAHRPDELIIIGRSAGGTIASSVAHQFAFSGTVELHTIASPLHGVGLGSLADYFAGGRSGFEKEIVAGFTPFTKPPSNWKVFHHKTVTDSFYENACKGTVGACNTASMQNNNISGSLEFFYPVYDHNTIMDAVTENIMSCRA